MLGLRLPIASYGAPGHQANVLVEKHDKRHSEEPSDMAILFAFNNRDCHAVARNDKNVTFSTLPELWANRPSSIYKELPIIGLP